MSDKVEKAYNDLIKKGFEFHCQNGGVIYLKKRDKEKWVAKATINRKGVVKIENIEKDEK